MRQGEFVGEIVRCRWLYLDCCCAHNIFIEQYDTIKEK